MLHIADQFLFSFVLLTRRPIDKQRGYAFVEFELEEDAADAIENMDGSELFGKMIRCNVAKAMPKLTAGQAVWKSEEWNQTSLNQEQDQFGELTLVPDKPDDDEE